MTTPDYLLDPFLAGRTSQQAGAAANERARRLREHVRADMAGEKEPTRGEYDPGVDGDTQFRGGKSRSALKSERRPKLLRYDELGYDDQGHWNPYADGAV